MEESRGEGTQALLGKGIMQKGIPHKIEFAFTWLTFAFIGIGIVTLIRRYKEMSFSELKFKKHDFLKEKFEVEYFMIALVCSGLLVGMVAIPFLSDGYNLDRLYGIAITILSVFFVIGGITLSKQTFKKSLIKNLSFKKKALPKKEKQGGNALQNPLRKSVAGRKASQQTLEKFDQKASQVRAYLVILLVLIPYFLCVTGIMYNIFDVPRGIIFNSEGVGYDRMYVHDQDSCAAKWLKGHVEEKNLKVYGDASSVLLLISQATMNLGKNVVQIVEPKKVENYIYLRYDNVINDRLYIQHKQHNMTEYQTMFVGKSMIYNNGGSEVWR